MFRLRQNQLAKTIACATRLNLHPLVTHHIVKSPTTLRIAPRILGSGVIESKTTTTAGLIIRPTFTKVFRKIHPLSSSAQRAYFDKDVANELSVLRRKVSGG